MQHGRKRLVSPGLGFRKRAPPRFGTRERPDDIPRMTRTPAQRLGQPRVPVHLGVLTENGVSERELVQREAVRR